MVSSARPTCSVSSGADDGSPPLTHPFPDYLMCPHCGECEVEIWCYEDETVCHRCGGVVAHTRASCGSDCVAPGHGAAPDPLTPGAQPESGDPDPE